ncbi:MAG: TonB-dependent receptor, partial [Paramuribaculum sp.]|nr:TonB-dependent receptor [Paramuribaculum sp.]
GGLGGLVKLSTEAQTSPGVTLQYIQGIGSFRTFDEFLRFGYSDGKWQSSTRLALSTSPNDYKYVNHDKKLNIYDEEMNIIGQYHPTERNRSGAYRDFHLMQEVRRSFGKADNMALSIWYINSNRELPVTTTDYGDSHSFDNRQREQTLRAVASWNHKGRGWKTDIRGGYIHTAMAYDYSRETAPGNWAHMTRSRSRVNTFFAGGEWEWRPARRWFFSASLSAHQHFVRSEDKNIILTDGGRAIVGYDKGRIELSGSASARWQPVDPVGVSLVLREEMFGNRRAPLIPALFVDALLSRKGNVMFKGSVSKNHKFPTLNDLYFLPGGNPDLRNESGLTY